MMLKRIFEPIKIGKMEISNRICMGELGPLGDGFGNPSQQTIDFYVDCAKGGAGMITVGGSYPSKAGATSRWGTWLFEDAVIPGWKKLVQAMRQANSDCKLSVQLLHCGRQMHVGAEGAFEDTMPVAPSAIPYRFGPVPHELSTEEVELVVQDYVDATMRAKESGFDCVGLHGAHGYLISQFISPYSNRRTDKYGGSIESRARFACEIIEGIKKNCGDDFPVIIKINCEDYIKAPEQIDLEHTKVVVPLLEKAGADAIVISGGQHESYIPVPVAPYTVPPAFFSEATEEIKKIAQIPIGVSCRINSPALGEQLIAKNKADLVWAARPFMADPEFPRKAKEGRMKEIRHCIACNTCIDMLWDDWIREWHCAVNPECMRGAGMRISKTTTPKKVLVIGGGPAGCEAARVAKSMGHNVILWEKETKLGGQINIAALPPSKHGYRNIIVYYEQILKSLNVQVMLNEEATVEKVRNEDPDVIILATGSLSRKPDIPGKDGPNVVDGIDVIAGRISAGERVIVIGGGVVGMEAAETLMEQGKKVTMVVRGRLGKGMVRMVYHVLRARLKEGGVEILTDTPTLEIDSKGATVLLPSGESHHIVAETVVIATGAKGNRALLDSLEDEVREIHIVGDALKPRNIQTAIYQGAMLARSLESYQPKKWKR